MIALDTFNVNMDVKFQTWLAHKLRGELTQYFRDEKPTRDVPITHELPQVGRYNTLLSDLVYSMAEQALNKNDLRLFRMHYMYGIPMEELGNSVGVSRQYIDQRLKRMVKQVKSVSDKRGYNVTWN